MEATPEAVAPGPQPLQTPEEVWGMVEAYYENARKAKAEGKPIAWSCYLVEKEIFHAMGIYPMFPEDFAAWCAMMGRGGSMEPGVEKEAVRFCRLAEAEGYPSYTCGYVRSNMGYVINNDFADAPFGGMARPDLMIASTSLCDARVKWYEDMSQRMGVPLFILDRPERKVHNSITSMPERYEVDYYKSQLEDCLGFMEQVTGNKYDPAQLDEALDWSYKLNEVAQEILELRKSVPCPMGIADELSVSWPYLFIPGTKEAYEFFVRLRDEVRERVEQGIGLIPEEKFRLMWIGYALWFNFDVYSYMEKHGGVIVRSPEYFAFPYPPRDHNDPLGELATRFLSAGYGAYGMAARNAAIVHDCQEFKIDGAILAYLQTCRANAFWQWEVRHILEERGIPTASVEGDMVDERLYSEGQVNTRLDALAEQILRKKS